MPSPDENLTSYTPLSYKEDRTYFGGGGYVSGWISQGNAISLRRIRTTVSTSTPNFKTYKRFNRLPLHAYSKSIVVISDPSISWYADIRQEGSFSQRNDYIGNLSSLGCSFDGSSSAPDPYGSCVSKLLSEISLAKANTGVALAEAHKTADHVARTATRLFNAIRALKKGHLSEFGKALGVTTTRYQERSYGIKFSKAAGRLSPEDKRKLGSKGRKYTTEQTHSRITNLASETWLEYSYGWKPLLNDVYNHAEALANTLVQHELVVRHASAKSKTSAEFNVTDSIASAAVWTRKRKTVDNRFVKIGVSYRLPPDDIYALHAFGVTSPLVIAWEIVPFSFVADWFIPIGKALEQITATSGLIFHSGYHSLRNVQQVETSFEGGQLYGDPSSFNIVGHGSGKAHAFRMDIRRYELSAFPSPQPPEFKDPRSIAHGLSAIALLQSIFLKKK